MAKVNLLLDKLDAASLDKVAAQLNFLRIYGESDDQLRARLMGANDGSLRYRQVFSEKYEAQAAHGPPALAQRRGSWFSASAPPTDRERRDLESRAMGVSLEEQQRFYQRTQLGPSMFDAEVARRPDFVELLDVVCFRCGRRALWGAVLDSYRRRFTDSDRACDNAFCAGCGEVYWPEGNYRAADIFRRLTGDWIGFFNMLVFPPEGP